MWTALGAIATTAVRWLFRSYLPAQPESAARMRRRCDWARPVDDPCFRALGVVLDTREQERRWSSTRAVRVRWVYTPLPLPLPLPPVAPVAEVTGATQLTRASIGKSGIREDRVVAVEWWRRRRQRREEMCSQIDSSL